MDADGLTFALRDDRRGARREAARPATPCASASRCERRPDGRLVSFGVAGSLRRARGRRRPRRDARRRRERRDALGGRASASAARAPGRSSRGASSSTTRPSATRLREASGADAVDMESGDARAQRPARRRRPRDLATTLSSYRRGARRTSSRRRPHERRRPRSLGRDARRGDAIRSMRDALRALHALEERRWHDVSEAASSSPRRARSAPASTARSRSSSGCSSSTARRSTSATRSSTTSTSCAGSRSSAPSSSRTRTRSRRARSASSRRTASRRR